MYAYKEESGLCEACNFELKKSGAEFYQILVSIPEPCVVCRIPPLLFKIYVYMHTYRREGPSLSTSEGVWTVLEEYPFHILSEMTRSISVLRALNCWFDGVLQRYGTRQTGDIK